MKSAIRGAWPLNHEGGRRQREENVTEGEEEIEREDMACLREEESDGMSSGTISVKRG